jgi:hypothetical protein
VSAPALRELSVGEILDVAIKITMRNAWTLFGLVALIVAPIQLLVVLVEISAFDDFDDFATTGTSQDYGTFAAAIVVIVVLGLVSALLSTAVAFRAVVEAYLGGRAHWRESLAFVGRRLHSLAWLLLVSAVFLLLAFAACILPGVWLSVAWVVAIPVLLTEDVRGVGALRRSFRLVRGRWWPTFGIVLLGFILVGIVGAVIQGVFGALFFVAGDSDLVVFLVDGVGATLGSVLTTPFTAAFITVVYVDLRVRKEGFDLQLLVERLGVSPDEVSLSPLMPIGRPPGPGVAAAEGDRPPYWPPPPGWKPRSDSSSEP